MIPVLVGALLLAGSACKKNPAESGAEAEESAEACKADDDCDEGLSCVDGKCKESTADRMRRMKEEKLKQRDDKLEDAVGE
jgi:hypothetical protein